MIEFIVDASTAGQRPDRALRTVAPGLDRAGALRALKGGRILVNGAAASLRTLLAAGDAVAARVTPPPARAAHTGPAPALVAVARQHGFGLLLLDDQLCVVDKPAGMATHGATGVPAGESLVERAAAFLAAAGRTTERPPAAAGRLDRGTSGVVVLTLSRAAEQALAHAFEGDGVRKEYLALCHGGTAERFTVTDPLMVARYRPGAAKVKKLKEAATDFERLAASPTATLLRVLPRTGRLHQIRRHLRAAGHPIVGDGRYGHREDRGSHDFCLHCARVSFTHPTTGRALDFRTPLPAPFLAALKTHGVAWRG
ncbi:MAG: RluA family pseudouridine synthase [Deltaproteobacteria bacterium]|nr:RluA family pseudouridine synthase [Deltaproteobacteria bacterium]